MRASHDGGDSFYRNQGNLFPFYRSSLVLCCMINNQDTSLDPGVSVAPMPTSSSPFRAPPAATMANFDDQPILVLGSAENSAFLARCAYREPAITETGVWPLQRQPRAIRATDTLAGIYDAEQADGSTLRNLVRSEVNSLTWTVISPLHIVTTTDGTTGQYEEEMIQILVRPESTTPEKAGEVASRVWNVLKRFVDCVHYPLPAGRY